MRKSGKNRTLNPQMQGFQVIGFDQGLIKDRGRNDDEVTDVVISFVVQ